MVDEEILGGLKSALERGESMKRAMMTLLNAGYKKEEIEEAARFLLESDQKSNSAAPTKTSIEIPATQKTKPQIYEAPKTYQLSKIQSTNSKPIQKVSDYGEEKKSRKNLIILILIISIALLFGILLLVLLFL